MSNELRTAAGTGNTVYANIISPSSRRWNGTSFEAYSSAHYLNYPVTMTEQGSSGVYVGDMPAAVSDAGVYEIFYYIQQGGAPEEGDPIGGIGRVEWDGTAVATTGSTVAGEMSGSDFYDYVLRIFKRTDKSLEVYDAINDSIAEIRRKIRTRREEKETAFTQQITVLGQYKINVESDLGLNVSDVFIRGTSKSGFLTAISKAVYDNRYGRWGTDANHRQQPVDYCFFGGQILLGPVPDSIDYTYVTSYSKDDHVQVSAATVSVPFTTTDYKEILRRGVLFRLYDGVENDEQSQKHFAFWKAGMAEIETKERRNRRVTTIQQYNDF